MPDKQPLHTFLFISDQRTTVSSFREWFQNAGFASDALVHTPSNEVSTISVDGNIDLIVIDDRLQGFSSIEMLQLVSGLFPLKAKLMLTRKSDRQQAVDAMKLGATDYLFKRDLTPEAFEKAIQHCIEYTHHQELLNRRNAVIDALFDQAEEAIFLADSNGILVLYNEVFSALFSNGQNEQDNFNEFVHSNLKQEEWDSLLSGKEQLSTIIQLEQNREIKYLRVNIKRIDLNDGFRRLLGMISDVTAEKVAEQEQIKSEKLQLTSRMAQILAHEVRNPLTNIRLSADYLNEAFQEHEEYGTYAEIIERNVQRIDDLIGHMLQSVRPFEIRKESTKLQLFLDQLLHKVEDRRALLDVSIEAKLEGKLTSWKLDQEKLELALVNLMTNAFEAMMHTENPKLKVSISKKNDQLSIVISDNGKGMPDDVVERLFDAFYTKRKGGMGLGMTMVKNIVEGHGGEIHVDSAEQRGTNFSIVLP